MNTWAPIGDMSDSRAYGSAAAVGGQVYALGGLQSDMEVGPTPVYVNLAKM